MQDYDFILKFELPDSNIDPDTYIDALYESGCDDAMIGIGKKGYIALDFTREAPSASVAIRSAIEDVKKAIPQAILFEVSPDLVGVTDLAKLLGCSRQNILQLMSKGNSRCPHPVYEGAQSIWHLLEVLTWLSQERGYSVDESLKETAIVTRKLNLARQTEIIDCDIPEDVKTLVA